MSAFEYLLELQNMSRHPQIIKENIDYNIAHIFDKELLKNMIEANNKVNEILMERMNGIKEINRKETNAYFFDYKEGYKLFIGVNISEVTYKAEDNLGIKAMDGNVQIDRVPPFHYKKSDKKSVQKALEMANYVLDRHELTNREAFLERFNQVTGLKMEE